MDDGIWVQQENHVEGRNSMSEGNDIDCDINECRSPGDEI
jgi:hypothetical protein